MKKLLLLILCATLFAHTNLFAQRTALTKTLATVSYNGSDSVSEQTFTQSLKAMEAQTKKKLNGSERRQLLDEMINALIITQAAAKDKISVSGDETLTVLRNALQMPNASLKEIETKYNGSPAVNNQPWSVFLNEMRRQVLIEKYLSSQVKTTPATEAEVQKAYDDHKANFKMPANARVSHIFFNFKGFSTEQKSAALAKAQASLKKLENGTATFEELVRTESEDGNSSNRLGDIGYIMNNDEYKQLLGNEFVSAVFTLRAGQTSKIVSSPEGYHILKVTEKQGEKQFSLNDKNPSNPNMTVKQLVQSQLQMLQYNEGVLKLIEKLRKESAITINEGNWGPWERGEKDAS